VGGEGFNSLKINKLQVFLKKRKNRASGPSLRKVSAF
jgi:hypothetical protein